MSGSNIQLVLARVLGHEPGKLHDNGAWCGANLRHVKKIRNKDDLENICIYKEAEEDGDKITKKENVKEYIKGDKLCTFEGMIVGLLIRGFLAAKKNNTYAVGVVLKLIKRTIRNKGNFGKNSDDLRKKPKYLAHADTWEQIKDIEKDGDLNLSNLPQVDQEQIAMKGRRRDVIKEELSNMFKGKRETEDSRVQTDPEEIKRFKSHSKRRMTSEQEKNAYSGSENFDFNMNGDDHQDNNVLSDESSSGDENI